MKALFVLSLLGVVLAGCSGGSSDPVSFTLSGTVTYEDREYGTNAGSPTGYGFTGTTSDKPVRHARVEVVDGDDTVLASASTNDQGNYSITATGKGTLSLWVLTATPASHPIQVEVVDAAGNLTAASKTFIAQKGAVTLDLNVPTSSPAAGALNILDVFLAGGEFTHALAGAYPPALRAYWQPGSSDGTYFCSSCARRSIYILGGGSSGASGDTDEYDDDVLWHEYGHFLEDSFGRLDSKGGLHAPGDDFLDLRLAWSEGWSDFLPGAVKSWLQAQGHPVLSMEQGIPPFLYIDTIGNDGVVVYDFAASGPLVRYASDEAAVAKALSDLRGDLGMTAVWEAFTAMPAATPPASLETFYDSWLSVHQPDPTQQALVLGYLADRTIDYTEDNQEEDGTVGDANPLPLGTPRTYTLYKPGLADEKDLTSFSATAGSTYRIETYGLVNGADTYLRILYSDGNPVIGATNDNYAGYVQPSLDNKSQNIHDGCTLASRLEFMPNTSGTYYAEVSRPASLPLAAGRYGGYNLKITENPTAAFACP